MNNTVEWVGSYGGDVTHALSAWTSTKRELTPEKEQRIDKLLTQLAQAEPNAHESPFEKSAIHFLCKLETASHIQLLKHRIAVSVNGESARYKEHREVKFYIPDDWPEWMQRDLQHWCEEAFHRYHETFKALEAEGFSRKRAKESARFYLPYASQIYMDVMFNFRSFIHFQRLRNEEHAQDEIHQVAEEMLRLVRECGDFDLSLAAFGY